MLLYFTITGIFLSVILLFFNARQFKSSLYLGGFFFSLSFYSFIEYALFYSGSRDLIAVMYVHFSFTAYLIGPLLFFYVRSILTDDSRLKKIDFLHFAPAALILLATLPYFFTSWEVKLEYAGKILDSIGFLNTNKPSLLSLFVPNSIIYLSRPVIIFSYLVWSSWIFLRYLMMDREKSVFSGQRYMVKWICILLGFSFLLVSSHILVLGKAFADRDSVIFFTFNLLQLISAIGLTGLLISPFFFPGILYGLPRFPAGMAIRDDLDLSEEKIQKRSPGFESEYLEHIKLKIDSCMINEKPYLQPTCNLTFISKLTQVPAHHLSYYFREEKRQSFNDYRNELRVNHAKNLIREGKARELTLEAIGLLSGFSTRNTFFTAFKKVEGLTPGMYSSRF
jgi:AraC-like DNA-binding protein